MALLTMSGVLLSLEAFAQEPKRAAPQAEVRQAIDKGLAHLAGIQTRGGQWTAEGGVYPEAMTALAGMAFLMDGNTTLQGRYAKNVQAAVGFLLDQAQPSGLIGDPRRDQRYIYGHGFSMLFLSEVLGEEEDISRRKQIVTALSRAVEFSGRAQTKDGGWGYVSARDGNGFDEGSTTVTQMQGLRACRDAGIAVPREIIAKGINYIERCTDAEGGVRYSLQMSGGGAGARPPITAAAVVCLFSAGEYENPLVKKLSAYADKSLGRQLRGSAFGYWHYAHYYYAQGLYRRGDARWIPYREQVAKILLEQQAPDGSWNDGFVGAVYATALSLAILQLDSGYLPIYQR